MTDWLSTGTSAALAWLLTYGIHSTLLLVGAWFLTARVIRSDGAREMAWRTALIGGLVTATGQRLLGGGAIEAPTVTVPVDAGPAVVARTPTLVEAAPSPALPGTTSLPIAALPHLDVVETGPLLALPTRTTTAAAGPLDRWPHAVLAGGAVMICLGTLALAARVILLRRRLAERTRLDDLDIVRCLRRLEQSAGRRRFTRLTTSTSIDTPIAFGVLRPEICLPVKATRLPLPLIETMLAHELAHVSRRDPAWLLASRLMETAFVFQPLNRLASRRLVDLAEYRCDAWAAELTGSPIGLARCLTEVAGWVRPAAPALAPAMAVTTSRLEERVDRLLESPARSERRGRRARTTTLCVACVAAVAFIGPGVAPGGTSGGHHEHAPAEHAALDGLDEELRLLDGEIEALARRLDGHAAETELTPLVDRLRTHGVSLRARRSGLAAIDLDENH